MKVILLRDVPEQGHTNDVVEVSEGYARNFLFPQNLAVQATEAELRARKEREAKKARDQKRELQSSAKLARDLDGREFTMKEKVNEQGKLYAAVTAKSISDILRKEKISVDESMIELAEPIKETGEREVTVNLPHGFEARIRITIEGK